MTQDYENEDGTAQVADPLAGSKQPACNLW